MRREGEARSREGVGAQPWGLCHMPRDPLTMQT